MKWQQGGYVRAWGDLVKALAIGGAGGWLASKANVPMGWMLGSLGATGAAALAGLDLKLHGILRWLVLSVIGLYVGNAIDLTLIDWLVRSKITVVVMLVLVTVQVLCSAQGMRWILGCNWATAMTACVPGGFSTMLVIAKEYGGDERVVAVVQVMRVVVVVAVISLTVRAGGKMPLEADLAAVIEAYPKGWIDAYLILLGGILIGLIVRIPIIFMVAPMILTGIWQYYSEAKFVLPPEPLSMALVILGSAIGVRFNVFRSGRMLILVLAGLGLGFFLVSTSLATAWVLSMILDFPFFPILLAVSPGGISEINLIALANNIEPAFVSMHHMIRLIYVFLLVPITLMAVRMHAARTKPVERG